MKWADDSIEGYLNFYSASGDGRVTNWTIIKTALTFADAMNVPFCRRLENFNQANSKNTFKGK